VPNPIGVTTIASINGRGSYARRSVSHRIVRANLRSKPARAGTYEERYASARRILGREAPRYEQNFSEGRGKARAVPNPRKKKESSMAGKRKKAKRKLTKAERRAISLRNLKKARAARKTKAGGRKSTKTRRTSARRTTGKTRRTARRAAPRLLTARIGKTTRKTYMSATRGGKARKVPAYELLGFKSQKAMGDYLNSDKTPPKQVERLRKRLNSIFTRRKRASEHVLKHGDAFTPNKRVIPYSEWSASMTPNKRKTKKSRSAAAKKRKKTLESKFAGVEGDVQREHRHDTSSGANDAESGDESPAIPSDRLGTAWTEDETFLAQVNQERSEDDIPPEDFASFQGCIEETLETPDEVWSVTNSEDVQIYHFIRHYAPATSDEATLQGHWYVIVARETDEEEQIEILDAFPTRDAVLVDRYRRGSQQVGETQEERPVSRVVH
jgi:hypothetical protein